MVLTSSNLIFITETGPRLRGGLRQRECPCFAAYTVEAMLANAMVVPPSRANTVVAWALMGNGIIYALARLKSGFAMALDG